MIEPPPKGNWMDDTPNCQECVWVVTVKDRPGEIFCSNTKATFWATRQPNVTDGRKYTNCAEEGVYWESPQKVQTLGSWR